MCVPRVIQTIPLAASTAEGGNSVEEIAGGMEIHRVDAINYEINMYVTGDYTPVSFL